MRTAIWMLAIASVPAAARATECGELRRDVNHLRAAAAVDEAAGRKALVADSRAKLKTLEKKMATACAPRKVTVAALPLGYISLPPGNLSKATFDAGENWGLTFTTQAGAAGGLVFNDAATMTLPPLHLETELSPAKTAGEILVALAFDAALTVEEPQPGHGTWAIEVKNKPQLVAMSKLRACAAGKPDPALKLSASACSGILPVDPLARPTGSEPERGRAFAFGEWQYAWHATLELGPEIARPAPNDLPPPRVAFTLELSAPVPGVSDGKKFAVALEQSPREQPGGFAFKLGQGCGDDDQKCEDDRFPVEIWYDRAFGVPFLRAPETGAQHGQLAGKVSDRLARPVANQRILVTDGARRIITISDAQGDYNLTGLTAGDATVIPCGKDPAKVPTGDESRAVKIGAGETKVPVIFINKLFE